MVYASSPAAPSLHLAKWGIVGRGVERGDGAR